MSTHLSPAEQERLVNVVLGDVFNALNAPQPYAPKIEAVRPFVAVFDETEIDPSDDRPVHPSELRRIQVPYVRAINRTDASMKMTSCSIGSGEAKPYPLDRMVRELADTGDRDGRLPNGGLRWKVFGNAH